MAFFEDLVGSLIGAGSKLIGGSMSESSADARAAQNIAAQKDFAQHGVSWKVADAKSAGISPLAALGASTTSFSNVVGGEGKMGEAVSDMGQDISKAASAFGNREQKELLLKGAQLDLEGKKLDNDIKRSELASKMSNVVGRPPSAPGPNADAMLPGQGNTKGGKFVDPWGEKQTPIYLGGAAVYPGQSSDANQGQNRWDDFVSQFVGPHILDDDMARSGLGRIPGFLWNYANKGAQDFQKWMYDNRWEIMKSINQSLGSSGGDFTNRKARW